MRSMMNAMQTSHKQDGKAVVNIFGADHRENPPHTMKSKQLTCAFSLFPAIATSHGGALMKRLVLLTMVCVGAFALFIAASAQAQFNVGTEVLSDDFTGSTLNAPWGAFTGNAGTATLDGVSSMLLQTFRSGTSGSRYIRSNASLEDLTDLSYAGLASANDWGVEIKFQMLSSVDTGEWVSPYDSRQWIILAGTTDSAARSQVVQGFDLRATRYDGTHWALGWYGFDFTGGVSTLRTVDFLGLGGEISRNQDTTYTIDLHRKPDGMVDIYLDGTLLGTESLIGGLNPVGLMAGDITQAGVGGKMALDLVKIGSFTEVPEPATLTSLATGLFVLLAYNWRKRRTSWGNLANSNRPPR
jgi:hypothetical protein